jgi:hypothetical protein
MTGSKGYHDHIALSFLICVEGARESAERSTDFAPAVVLGVRVADAHGVRAA